MKGPMLPRRLRRAAGPRAVSCALILAVAARRRPPATPPWSGTRRCASAIKATVVHSDEGTKFYLLSGFSL